MTRAKQSLRAFRREQIVAAARQLVARDGLDGLTIGALEKLLRFSRGVITYHFRDKDEIVEAVLRSAVADIDADTTVEVHAATTFPTKLEAVLRTKLRGFVGNAEAGRILMSFWGRLQHDARARRLNAQLFATYREQSRTLIEAGQRAGAFAKCDAEAMAALTVGTVIGLATQAYFADGAIDLDSALREASSSLNARLSRTRAESRPKPSTPPPPKS